MTPWFLAAAAAMAVAAALFVLSALRRSARPAPDRGCAARANAQVLRDHLEELRAAHAAGSFDAREFFAAQDELQRRVLAEAASPAPPAADAALSAQPVRCGPNGRAPGSRAALLAVALALPAAALALYLQFGRPYLIAAPVDDPGRGDRPSAALLAQLEAHVAAVPKDARAWILLARARMESGHFTPAAAAYRRALDAQPKVARDPQVWCEYADAAGMAQGGRLAGEPRELIERALAIDPAAPCALEMAGSAAVEARDFRAARDHWGRLLAQLPENTPRHVQLSTALARVEQQARFALPARSGSPAAR